MRGVQISVIVVCGDGYGSIRKLVSSLRAQAEARSMELVLVFPRGCPPGLPEEDAGSFAGVRLVEVDRIESMARARAAGVRAASAPLVVMTEDHSLPEPGWAAAFLQAHREHRAAVGPAIVNGNPESLLSWANVVIEYGEWLDPAPSRPAQHLPGHNSCYRRDVLLDYGEELGDWLEAESVLHWHLRSKGHQLWLAGEARTRHHNVSLPGPTLRLRYLAGRHFAGMCRKRWRILKRTLYLVASPLIPLIRLRRIVRELRRPGRPARLLPMLVPLCLFLLVVETAGAVVGYLTGAGDCSADLVDIDLHRERFMNPPERWRLAE